MNPEQDAQPQSDVKAEQTTEEPTNWSEADDKAVNNILGIPENVQAEISSQPEPEPEKESKEETPEPEPEPITAEKQEEEKVEEDDEEESEEEEHEEEKPEGKPDKRQKRIDRLTRQKNELKEQLESAKDALAKIDAEKEKREETQQQKQADVIKSQAEATLEAQQSVAEKAIAWCEQNPEGGTYKEGDKEQVLETYQEVAAFKHFAEKEVLRLTPEIALAKRDAKQAYAQAKAHWDGQAKQVFPDMFDKKTKLYQEAEATLRDVPGLAQHPAAHWFVGLGLLGLKTLQEMQKQKPNGEKKHRDISERAFEPRVPIAPHSAQPPSREATPTSRKKIDQAAENLFKEGGRENLVALLNAEDELRPDRPASKRLVKT